MAGPVTPTDFPEGIRKETQHQWLRKTLLLLSVHVLSLVELIHPRGFPNPPSTHINNPRMSISSPDLSSEFLTQRPNHLFEISSCEFQITSIFICPNPWCSVASFLSVIPSPLDGTQNLWVTDYSPFCTPSSIHHQILWVLPHQGTLNLAAALRLVCHHPVPNLQHPLLPCLHQPSSRHPSSIFPFNPFAVDEPEGLCKM